MFVANLSNCESFVLPALAKPALQHAPNRVGKPSASAETRAAEARAIALVENLQEVRAWKKMFGPKQFNPATNGRQGLSIDSHRGSIYTVYVYEDKPEQVLTFARYDVNVKTGKVQKLDSE